MPDDMVIKKSNKTQPAGVPDFLTELDLVDILLLDLYLYVV